jgi:ribose-phosphate pyrophosphokinase
VVQEAGATRIFAAATHGLLSGGAVERLRNSVIEKVVVSDTVPLPEGADPDLFQVLSVDRILADSVHNVFCDESVSAIFAGENQLF